MHEILKLSGRIVIGHQLEVCVCGWDSSSRASCWMLGARWLGNLQFSMMARLLSKRGADNRPRRGGHRAAPGRAVTVTVTVTGFLVLALLRSAPAAAHTCRGEYSVQAGLSPVSLSDGSGNADYANNVHCLWHVSAPVGYSVGISFTFFQLQNASPCRDFVRVYDGSSTEAFVVGTFCGAALPTALRSSGAFMTLQFFTDDEIVGAGFEAIVESGVCTNAELSLSYVVLMRRLQWNRKLQAVLAWCHYLPAVPARVRKSQMAALRCRCTTTT